MRLYIELLYQFVITLLYLSQNQSILQIILCDKINPFDLYIFAFVHGNYIRRQIRSNNFMDQHWSNEN